LIEPAYTGPAKLLERLGAFDARTIDCQDHETFVEVCRTPPAVHRYPGSMAARIQTLCRSLVDDWDGDASALWTTGDPDGREVYRRLLALPGFGEQKARIFVALLGKQYGFTGAGWREAAGSYGDEGSYRSVADIVDADSLTRVRETKRAAKAAAKKAT